MNRFTAVSLTILSLIYGVFVPDSSAAPLGRSYRAPAARRVAATEPSARPIPSTRPSSVPVPVGRKPASKRVPVAAAARGDAGGRPPTTQPRVHEYRAYRGRENYWRLAQTQDGVWWFLSPANEKEFLNSVTTVQPFQAGRSPNGPDFVSRDFRGSTTQPAEADVDAWARAALGRVRDAGFKGLGAWCNPAFHKLDVPMTRDLNLSTWLAGSHLKFYSPGWPDVLEKAIRGQVEPLRDNRNLVGYYLDNELDWGDSGAGPANYFNGLAAGDPNRQRVTKVIQTTWKSIEQFNLDWNTKIASWDDLDKWTELPSHQTPGYGRLFSAWLSHLATDYFELNTRLLRKYDSNHLILGVRFKGYAPVEVVRASRAFTDAQSINVYPGDAQLDAEMFQMIYEASGEQPIIISEYSFHALDGRSGNRNTVGFSAQVLDQRARAEGYEKFTTRLSRVPFVVGADWFQWMDEPPSGRGGDGEDVNFGVVDVDDHPYEALGAAIRRTAPQLNELHSISYRDDQKDVWRESFANKPMFQAPHLAQVPSLRGNVKDWPRESKLDGMRHSHTVGLERSTLPLPNVYVGWRDEGLYVAMEVFDNDIQGAPAKGWWWTRDCAELWVSTRPVEPKQAFYNEFCHQFFFVPMDMPLGDRFDGCVGQWHRPGDALKDNLIPHPDVKEVVRVFPDRYVVEMFFPAKALVGWNPRMQPQLAMNVHVRNFQHAIDYFWSAPKELQTQYRPGTWGTLILEQPKQDRRASEGAAVTPNSEPAQAREWSGRSTGGSAGQ